MVIRLNETIKVLYVLYDICKFSALNENNLKMHVERHHKKLSCKLCEYKTSSENDMRHHSSKNHKKNTSTGDLADVQINIVSTSMK